MRKALLIGATGGIGRALHGALADIDYEVTALSRRADGFDLRDEQAVERRLTSLTGPYDMIFVATGALETDGMAPEKSVRHVSQAAFAAQFAVNAIGPALILRHASRLLPRDRRCIFAALSARVGSIGDNRLGGWYSYRASKAALNQIIKTASIEIARTHGKAVCVALHPGTVATSFTEKYAGRHSTVSPNDAAQNLIRVLGKLSPEDSGGFFDWSGARVAY